MQRVSNCIGQSFSNCQQDTTITDLTRVGAEEQKSEKMTLGTVSSTTGDVSQVHRMCEQYDCNVTKLLAMVPKRRTAQFVTVPSVIEKPMLVNGFTTIFQVDGGAARISDIKQTTQPKTIYRIKPNTHAHIVNYVVVDNEGESMRKIITGDPGIMKKLLESQRLSAEQMLTKLMSGQSTTMQVSSTQNENGVPKVVMQRAPAATEMSITTSAASTATTTSKINVPISNMNTMVGALSNLAKDVTAKLPLRPITIKKVINTSSNTATTTTLTSKPTTTSTMSTNPHLLRLNSQIKVRSITSHAEEIVANTGKSSPVVQTTATLTTTRASLPLIKTVPLSQLQQQPKAIKQNVTEKSVKCTPKATKATIEPSTSNTTADNSTIEKMQQELEELRRTVAFLAETQKKTMSVKATIDDDDALPPAEKKSRLN